MSTTVAQSEVDAERESVGSRLTKFLATMRNTSPEQVDRYAWHGNPYVPVMTEDQLADRERAMRLVDTMTPPPGLSDSELLDWHWGQVRPLMRPDTLHAMNLDNEIHDAITGLLKKMKKLRKKIRKQ